MRNGGNKLSREQNLEKAAAAKAESDKIRETTTSYCEALMEKIKSKPAEVTYDIIMELWKPAKEAARDIMKGVEEYEADQAKRRAELDAQAAEIDKRIDALQVKINAAENRCRTAASRGNLDTAAAEEEKAEELKKAVSLLKRKRRIASSAELKGDPVIYGKIREAQNRRQIADEVCHQYVIKAVDLAEKWEWQFKELHRRAVNAMQRGSALPSYEAERVDKVVEHFNAPILKQAKAANQ